MKLKNFLVPKSNRELVIVIAITLIGTFLRLTYLFGRSYVGDEVGTFHYISSDFSYILSHFKTWLTMNYYIAALKFLTQIFGFNNLVLSALSIIPGIATIPMAWMVARQYSSVQSSIISILLISINPVLIEYSSIIRSYALLTFSALLLIKIYNDWRVSPNQYRAILIGFVVAFLLLIHPMGIYPILFICLDIFIQKLQFSQNVLKINLHKNDLSLLLIIFFFLLAVLILYLPILPDMFQEGKRWQVSYPTNVSYIPYALEWYFGDNILAFPSLFFLVFGLFSFFKSGGELRNLTLFTVFPIVGMSLQGLSHFPWGYARFLLYTLPVLIIFISYGLSTTSLSFTFFSKRKALIINVCLVLISWIPGLVKEFDDKMRLQWRESAAFLANNLKDSDEVLGMSWSESFHITPYSVNIIFENYGQYEITSENLAKKFQNKQLGHIYLVNNGPRIKTSYPEHVYGSIQIIDYYGKDAFSLLNGMRDEMIRTTSGMLISDARYTNFYKNIWQIGNYLRVSINQDYFFSMWQKMSQLEDRQVYLPFSLRVWDMKRMLNPKLEP